METGKGKEGREERGEEGGRKKGGGTGKGKGKGGGRAGLVFERSRCPVLCALCLRTSPSGFGFKSIKQRREDTVRDTDTGIDRIKDTAIDIGLGSVRSRCRSRSTSTYIYMKRHRHRQTEKCNITV